MPFPHCPQLVLTPPERSWEQMFRMLHGENADCEDEEAGFMMYCPFASQVEEDNGQHCPWEEEAHSVESQSWTAPNVWPDSWLDYSQ
ncbi:hypothetical protein IFM46972_00979 [Aspergillus udagawae]|uniref:Uncharacterized protein n=1 Tax=Aspergillus udagawae TaxID=91492 RepID=A0A8H3RLY5_9EURO|nr:hypothetical protein IFM46972_00979 [Aspergillus udagawae]